MRGGFRSITLFQVVFLFFIFGLLSTEVSAQPTTTDRRTLIRGELKSFLNRIPLIRVPIKLAPGNGHQSAGATVVTRLRQLGYENWIEIAYEQPTARQLAYLLPPFDPTVTSPQEFASLKLKFAPHAFRNGFGNLSPAILAISGAADGTQYPEDLNVEMLLELQPLRWSNGSYGVKVNSQSERPITNMGRLEPQLAHLRMLGYIFETDHPSSRNEILQWLKANMSHSPDLQSKIPGLNALLQNTALHELLPVYGHYVSSGWQLARIREAVSQALYQRPELFQGGVVIPVFNQVKDFVPQLIQDEALQQKADFLSADIHDTRLPGFLRGLKRGQVLVVYVGSVAKKIFEHFYSQATLPAVAEGMNSVNLMQLLGKPYVLSANIDYDVYHFEMHPSYTTLPAEEQAVIRLALKARDELAIDASPKSFIQMLIDSKAPNSALNRLYRRFAVDPQRDLIKDQLLRGLLMVRRTMAHWERQSETPVPPLSCKDVFL